jgi:hypothetical protein
MSQFPGGTGGGFFPMPPIWYPPIELKWLATGLIVFAGAVANRVQPQIRALFVSPAGFFFTALLAMVMFQYGFQPAAFAILFFLLCMWSANVAEEPFLNGSNAVDWVTSSKRWFVERVLKEDPIAIQEKDVRTYPVQGASAQGSTSTSSNT